MEIDGSSESEPESKTSDSNKSSSVQLLSGSESDEGIDLTMLDTEDDEDDDEPNVRPVEVAAQRGRGAQRGRYGRGRGRLVGEEELARRRRDKQWMENEVLDKFGSDLDEDDPALLLEKKEMPQMEPPPELLMQLLPYQKEFLAWAVHQERGPVKGGILADEMGMGKTIQAISLIVTHRTDDMSILPKTGVTKAQKTVISSDTKRFSLRLPGAPERSAPEARTNGLESLCPGHVSSSAHMENVAESLSVALDDAGTTKPLPGRGVKDPAPHVQEARAVVDESGPSTSSGEGLFTRATLVICPLVAVIQWRQEMEKFVAPDALNVVVYHGPKRGLELDAAKLSEADVVLTTYSIIENEYRRQEISTGKVCCAFCNKRLYPHKLRLHLRYFCGPWAEKTLGQAKQCRKKSSRPAGTKQHEAQGEVSDGSDQLESSASDDDLTEAETSGSISAEEGRSSDDENDRSKKFSKGADGKRTRKKASGKMRSAGKPGFETKDKGKTPMKGKHLKRRWHKKRNQSKGAAAGKGKEKAEDPAQQPFPTGGWSDLSDEELEKPKGGWSHIAFKAAALMVLRAQRTGTTGKEFTSVLHKVRWRRIVLDEAHFIKDRRSSTARATFALVSKYKWALSGTPLQNRVGELYSLVRFMRMFPYAYYLCKNGHKKNAREEGCRCISIDHPFQKDKHQCDLCGHSVMHHFCWWNKYVANPIKAHGYIGQGRAAMRLLKREILERILLRRTKVQCADVLMLPPRTLVLRKDHFNQAEQDYYEALYTKSQAQFGSFVQAGTVVNNYAHIFDLLIRLRQAVDHPYLVIYSATAPGGATAPCEQALQHLPGVCDICHDPIEDPVTAACGHPFCRLCIREYLESNPATCTCPTCDAPLTVDLTSTAPQRQALITGSRTGIKKNSILHRISAVTDFQSSTKIEALREELHHMFARDPAAKAIVFSQFTSMLDLIYFRLTQLGIKCVRLEGSMSMDQRDSVIDAFSNDATVKVFLMSLKAGGVALNLTAASHIMLMDPWWNPAVEQQAQDRIHRLGQYKPIYVTRFVIAGTIEERILKLQEKKQLVFEGTVGRDSEALGRLTEDDLRFLFG
eukprot:jgi/Botrbrau1/11932/Bobra.341_1s0001.2